METDELLSQLSRVQTLLGEEDNKRSRYRIENTRRKHNYLPFIMEMLTMLGNEGELLPIYQKAKQRAIERKDKKQEKKV